MRYNKQELVALASQTSQNFDREGVLVLKERQDGFFRRSEGCSVRWFRLRGNLLFYLKGPEPWYEPMGVIVLGHHQIKLQNQDENGYWPFHIVWDNGVSYRMATFHESERTLWLKAIQMAPYDAITSQVAILKERLNRIRPIIDVATYRMQKGIVTDMNEVPLCELALSCDNLLCDTHGRPPSPLVVVYVKFSKNLCVKYGNTEIADTCSNPCFSKTILFRTSDGLTGDATIRIVVYDVKELVSETCVPVGFTSLQLSMIQEAQRLRVALQTKDNKTTGFVTLNGWSLEPTYIGTSPAHTNDKNSIDIPTKILCHRRSQSLPPRLGLKLKFPSYGTLIKQNFLNSTQVTYRFHSGLGGDITVHEIMAEPKMCYQIPMQLIALASSINHLPSNLCISGMLCPKKFGSPKVVTLFNDEFANITYNYLNHPLTSLVVLKHIREIYIQREKELLEELLSAGGMYGQWQSRQLDLVRIHVAVLKHYCHAKRCMEHADWPYLKPSAKKEEASLEFAPINLHLQRMWVYNDTLNKSGFHDIVTVGAFAAHAHKGERTGGLIRLVQQAKGINSAKASQNSAANKIQAECDNTAAARRLADEVVHDMERIAVLLQARQAPQVVTLIDVIKGKVKSLLALYDPAIVEETLSYIGWPQKQNEMDNEKISSIMRLTEQLTFDPTTEYETFDASSSSSSKDASPTIDFPTLSSSVPNIFNNNRNKQKIVNENELEFHNDYFREERGGLNHSFRSVRSERVGEATLGFESHKLRSGSLRHDFKSSASLEQVSYRCLMDSLCGSDKKKSIERRRDSFLLPNECLDSATRQKNLTYLKSVAESVKESLASVIEVVLKFVESDDMTSNLEALKARIDSMRINADDVIRWLRVSHAALRLRCESPQWARDHAALQTRRDTCFSQALATVTAGLLTWFCSVPADIAVKVLQSGLGPLCGFEGLLSLYSTERAMWGDMVVAVEDLQAVVFTLIKVGHSNTAKPQVSGTRGALSVTIPVTDSLYSKIVNKEHLTFTVTAVFFNIGINEKATLAEALGETTPQHQSNSDNLDRLNKYYQKHAKLFQEHMAGSRAPSRTKPLEEVMENLRIAVHKKTPRNTEVLHLAALATRLMNGIRFTSCKSAKDRTGMSVTLEQSSILAQEYHLAETEMKKALSIMRSEGCRRENTLKNIGVRKFAFSKKQVMALPEDYRPPPGTYGSSMT